MYEKASGQRINQGKMTMEFSQNVGDKKKAESSTIWHTSATQQYNKYLGLSQWMVSQRKGPFWRYRPKCGICENMVKI